MAETERSLTIAMAQLNPVVGDVAGNTAQVIEAAIEARDRLGARLLITPELMLTGYPPEDLLLRKELALQCLHAVERLKHAISGIDLLVGLPWQDADGLHNAAIHLSDGSTAAVYAKQQLPNYSVFDEKRYFVPGHANGVLELTGDDGRTVNAAVLICEDVWQPGAMEAAAEAGAELALVLNASPFHAERGAEREATVRDRVGDCAIPTVYVNLVGGQDELVFDGGSFVMDAAGAVVQRAPSFEAGLHRVRLFAADVGAAWRPEPGPVAAHPEAAAAVYRALVLGLRDYVVKNGFPGVVVGLSGGVDSALTLAVAVDALGAERVQAVMMPSPYTREISLEDAAAEAEALGVDYRVLPIEGLHSGFLASLADAFAGTAPGVAEENIQARIRGTLLMALSNKSGRMVVTTGNKSEMAVGYATLYGDMAGGFAVLKDVPKTLVYQLCAWRNRRGAVIPERVLTRAPSAELAPDQQDSDSLPPYPELDAILAAYVEGDQPVEAIVASGYDRATVERVVRLVDRNEYKRRQAPPGVRVTRRAFGRDRRFPITSGYRHGLPES